MYYDHHGVQVSLARNSGRIPASVIFENEVRVPSDFVFGYPVSEEFELNDYGRDLRAATETTQYACSSKEQNQNFDRPNGSEIGH